MEDIFIFKPYTLRVGSIFCLNPDLKGELIPYTADVEVLQELQNKGNRFSHHNSPMILTSELLVEKLDFYTLGNYRHDYSSDKFCITISYSPVLEAFVYNNEIVIKYVHQLQDFLLLHTGVMIGWDTNIF